MGNLELGLTYSIYTLNQTYNGEKAKVIQEVIYEELKKYPVAIPITALINNENFTPPDGGDITEYLEKTIFYILRDHYDSSRYYVLFDDIIDWNNTIILDYEYGITGDLKISASMENPPKPEQILETINDALLSKYGTGVTINLSLNLETAPANTMEKLTKLVEELENITQTQTNNTTYLTSVVTYLKNNFKTSVDTILATVKEIQIITKDILNNLK